eukprot:CAMPEP_0118826930 /NCGR_PEP_ID=MMETSP1162-20130426/12289_1 /TAXON_ID=33656 /ORGANISM="Phaeocystis Sp, Strain CCMP2710" /LENGTH=74 /DNA_ID=CAMNT_0006757677 /DNA_START=111 /DNA_END=335 /DNA_ORIENTATION=+
MSTVATAAGVGLAAGIALGCALTSKQGSALTRTLSGGTTSPPPRQTPPPSSNSSSRDQMIGEALAGLVSRDSRR